MRATRVIILASILLLGVAACNQRGDFITGDDYTLACRIDPGIGVTSVQLLVFENDYAQLRLVDTAKVVDGTATFAGQIERPATAMLRFTPQNDQPLVFVLEKGESELRITPERIFINSGPLNHQYAQYINRRAKICRKRQAILQEYNALPPDDINAKAKLAANDSLLADSLQSITLKAINKGNAASRIIFERYVNTLSPENLKKVEAFK